MERRSLEELESTYYYQRQDFEARLLDGASEDSSSICQPDTTSSLCNSSTDTQRFGLQCPRVLT